MKTITKILGAATLAVATLMSVSCSKSYTGKVALNNDLDSVSYALGTFMGAQLKQMTERFPLTQTDSLKLVKTFTEGVLSEDYVKWVKDQLFGEENINEAAFKYGFTHQFVHGHSMLSEEQANFICQLKSGEIRKKKEEEKAKKAAENIEIGKKFLEENAQKDSVIVLENGLQYKVLATGTGASPKVTDKVKCHYEGRLIDGTVFDSSYKRNQPTTFPLNGVIKGWTEILQLMKEGDKWQVFIPSELGYGERGAGDNIAPNETLIFDIELIEVVK
ncbi:MAG: FKBP-type peptidyl-prolyl cis-trans isomerase [Bacteroidia bacterium]|nr:FKBP-type peptidyl-prolyl cis-trans isomerase [Bacteroidia bacterium]